MTSLDVDLKQQLTAVIKHAAANAPRSRQTAIGPSEVGQDCARRLAYKLLDWPAANPDGDPWPSIVGTATHAWLGDAFEAASSPPMATAQNIASAAGRMAAAQPGRYLVEKRLTIAPPLLPGGSCDLYDTWTETVIDHKVVGASSMARYKREGPRQQYRVQLHVYGFGWELAGRVPRNVALAFYPRGGLLSGLWVWSEPYDRQVALDAIARLHNIRQLAISLDPEAHPERWALIPATADHGCTYCPWWRPGSTDLSSGCPGEPGAVHPRADLHSLIAPAANPTVSTAATNTTNRSNAA